MTFSGVHVMSIAWLGEKRVGRFAGLKVKGLEGGRGSDQEKSKTPHAKTAYGAPGSITNYGSSYLTSIVPLRFPQPLLARPQGLSVGGF